MNLTEQHIWMRQYLQQQGMQNVRALLPEQIDNLINTSISDTVNDIIRTNVGITNDRIVTDNSKITGINALRTLYKVIEVNARPAKKIIDADQGTGTINNPFIYAKDKSICRTTANVNLFRDVTNKVSIPDTGFKYRFLVDLSVKYTRDNYIKEDANDPFDTNIFPVRIVEDAYLAESINDFTLRARVRTPVAVLYNDSLDIYYGILHQKMLDVNTSVLGSNGEYTNLTAAQKWYYLDEHMVPDILRVSYIAEPTRVQYREDLGMPNIEMDLPEYLHVDILKHAADMYLMSLNGNLQAAKQQQATNKNEMVRNNARDEGYQN